MIMIVAAASLIVFRIWATSLDFLLFRSITGRSNFHCTLANPIILALAVSHTVSYKTIIIMVNLAS